MVERSSRDREFENVVSDLMDVVRRDYPGSRFGFTTFNDYACTDYKICDPEDGHIVPE